MRIGIVNDIALAVEAMRRVIVSDGRHSVAWVAFDGRQAVDRCIRDRPDLVLMDLIMPHVDGVRATREIMARAPCAILVVTANLSGNEGRVFEAMGAGALDVVNTPVLEWTNTCKGAEALLAKIATVGKLVGAIPPAGAGRMAPLGLDVAPLPGYLVAIGASAGGPSALARVLQPLPADFPAPIVVVQHIDAEFAPALASWLDHQTALNVRLARAGDPAIPGMVLLANGDQHLVFTGPARVGYASAPAECSYQPSVDVFFRSIERYWKGEAAAVLLTGMGRDGAEGLLRLRRQGRHTIVQDQASSAVFGMPKVALELGAADEVLPLEQITARLVQLASQANRTKQKPIAKATCV